MVVKEVAADLLIQGAKAGATRLRERAEEKKQNKTVSKDGKWFME